MRSAIPRLALVLLSTVTWPGAMALAQQQPVPAAAGPRSIQVTGHATVTAKPDRARLDIGVVTEAPDSQSAAARNAQQLDKTLAALRKALGNSADIRTISYNLSPRYRYMRDGGEPALAGYTASNIVRVTLDDLTEIGSVIDTASQAGANQVQNIQFTLKDEQAVRSQALREAALEARTQANALASALGVKVSRVLSVVESGMPIQPVRDVMFARAEAAGPSTPIEAGTIEMRADVTLTVEIAEP